MSNQNPMATKPGIIKYTDIADLPLNDAIKIIGTSSRVRYGDVKLSDLLLNGSITDLKLQDLSLASNYGIGVYVFFDGDVPVYVGKAEISCTDCRATAALSQDPIGVGTHYYRKYV